MWSNNTLKTWKIKECIKIAFLIQSNQKLNQKLIDVFLRLLVYAENYILAFHWPWTLISFNLLHILKAIMVSLSYFTRKTVSIALVNNQNNCSRKRFEAVFALYIIWLELRISCSIGSPPNFSRKQSKLLGCRKDYSFTYSWWGGDFVKSNRDSQMKLKTFFLSNKRALRSGTFCCFSLILPGLLTAVMWFGRRV